MDGAWGIIIRFIAMILYAPVFLAPGLFIATLGAWVGSIYMSAQLPVKREMSNAKAPIYSHFGAVMAGLTTVRAYGAEEAFKEENRKRIDMYTRPARTYFNLDR